MNIIVCTECNAILVSRHRHDYQKCKCPNGASVDGGNDYCRGGAKDLNKVKQFTRMKDAKEYVANHRL